MLEALRPRAYGTVFVPNVMGFSGWVGVRGLEMLNPKP